MTGRDVLAVIRLKPLFAVALISVIINVIAGCAQQDRYSNIRVGGVRPTQPAAPPALPNAPPRIVSIWFSSDAIGPLQTLAIQVTTTTNVASVEARTKIFSINMPRSTFGEFAVRQTIPDIAPIGRRAFTLEIIARNAAGDEQVETLPFRLE